MDAAEAALIRVAWKDLDIQSTEWEVLRCYLQALAGESELALSNVGKALRVAGPQESARRELEYLNAVICRRQGDTRAAKDNITKALSAAPKDVRYRLEKSFIEWYESFVHERESEGEIQEFLLRALDCVPEIEEVNEGPTEHKYRVRTDLLNMLIFVLSDLVILTRIFNLMFDIPTFQRP